MRSIDPGDLPPLRRGGDLPILDETLDFPFSVDLEDLGRHISFILLFSLFQ